MQTPEELNLSSDPSFQGRTVPFLLHKIGRGNAIVLFSVVCLMSALELAGIAVIFPFLKLVIAPGEIGELLERIGAGKLASVLNHTQLCLALGLALALAYLGKTLALVVLLRIQSRRLAQFTSELTNELVGLLLSARYATFQQQPAPQVAGIAYSNTVHASLALNALMQIGNECLILLILFFGFAYFQPALALLGFFLSAILSYVLYATIIRRSSQLGVKQTELELVRYRLLFSIANAIRDIKIMGLSPLFNARNQHVSYEYSELSWRYNLNNALPRIFIELFALLGIVAVSLVVVLSEVSMATAGPLLGVAAVAALRAAPALAKIISQLSAYKFSRSFVLRLIDLRVSLFQAKVVRENDELTFTRSIKLRDVGFCYGDERILNKVSLDLKCGESIGIVGSSGAGKSTLLDLFTGLQQTPEGTFLCDEVKFDPFLSTSLQKWIGYVPQAITLIDDTIAFNVSFEEEPDRERIARALKVANLEVFVAALPEGTETRVGENGLRLSGGQRQRIGIARALYREPKILVFDEATSSLDTVTESELTSDIEGLSGQVSVIIVAHRLSTVMSCDRIYILSKGEIECSGTHAELLLLSPTYKMLYDGQQHA